MSIEMFRSNFLALISRKSGSDQAEYHEARMLASFQLRELNAIERKMRNDCETSQLKLAHCQKLADKIVLGKNLIYAKLQAGAKSDGTRMALCLMHGLAKFLEEAFTKIFEKNKKCVRWMI